MGTRPAFLKHFGKFTKRGLLSGVFLLSISLGIISHALSDSFIRSQVEYLISVIDANIEVQNLDEAGARNVYIGMREIYRGVIAVLDERIGDTESTPECEQYTNPIERAICESTHDNGGSTGSGSSGSTKTSIAILKSGIYNNATDWASTAFEVETDTSGKGYYIIRPASGTTSGTPTKDQLKNEGRSFDINQPEQVTKFRAIVATIQNVTLLPKTSYTIYYYITNDTISSEITTIPFTTTEAPIPYQKNYKKGCEGVIFEGTNRVQNYRWFDTDGKPQDLIQKCSQPNRANGGLICSESANGCCPSGQVAINGTCITPANAGGSCYATSGCKDGLSCNSNKICVSNGTGTGSSGSGGTGSPTVSASVTGIASTTTPGTFTNKAPQGTNIQLQYNSSNVGSMIAYQMFKGTGPLDNSNLATGTSFVQYANLVGNTSQTFNIPLQNLTIGTYRIVVTGCNSANQCASTPPVVFEVIAAGSSGTGVTQVCGAGSSFNFSSNGKNCVGVMPYGPSMNYQTTVNATQGQGTAVVKCTPTGWTVITPNCTVDKNSGGNTGGGTGSTGGGTGGTPGSDETPNDYQPSTMTPPAGYTDTSCQSYPTWSCPGTTTRTNPPTCYVNNINSEVSESDLNNAGALCYPGNSGPRQVMGLNVNRNNSTVTWFCTEIRADGSKRSEACGAKLKVNASCGSQAGAPIRREGFSLTNTPNLCNKGVPVKTYKYNGGTQFEPYYDYLIDDESPSGPLDYNTAYLTYTCGGINGGQDAICKTGKVIVDGECGGWVDTLYPTGLDGDINNPNNNKGICKAGKFSWTDQPSPVDGKNYAFQCEGYNGGRTVQCTVATAPTSIRGACGDINGKRLGIGNFSGWDSRGLGFVLEYVGANPPSTTGIAALCNVSAYGSNITGVVTTLDNNGNDGMYNWECNGKNGSGGIDPSTKAICSATKMKLGQCGTLNSGKIAGKQVTGTIAGVYTGPGTGDANGNMKLSNYFTLPGTITQYPALCANGSPHTIVDDVGSDGTFNWKCAGDSPNSGQSYLYNNYQDYNYANCSAEKIDPADYTVVAPPPTITQFNSSKTSADAGEQIQLGWTTSNVRTNGCELRGITSKNEVTFSLAGKPGNSTQMVNLPNDGSASVLYTLKCFNTSGASVERSTVVTISVPGALPVDGACSVPLVKNNCKDGTSVVLNTCTSDEKSTWRCNGLNGGNNVQCTIANPGCGGTGGGGSTPPQGSWSYTQSSWEACIGNCGAGRGTKRMVAKCLTSAGAVATNCSGTAPSQTESCTAPTSSCTPVSCPSGVLERSSTSGRLCSFPYATTGGGQSQRVNLSDGSYAQGTCSVEGNWGTWDVDCKNPAVVSCSGGGRTFTSADGSNSCYAEYVQKAIGQKASIGDGLTMTNGGQGEATCTSDGNGGAYWAYTVLCPGNTPSCPGGQGEFPAQNGDPACIGYYPITSGGQWANGTTNLGGTMRGQCGTDGKWIASSITYDCKP